MLPPSRSAMRTNDRSLGPMSSVEVQATPSTIAGESVGHSSRPPSGQLARPRPRPVLSCLRCRRRKIKCDRSLPCKQCTLTGHDAQCTYNAQPKSGDMPQPQNLNRIHSTYYSADISATGAANLNGSISSIDTESPPGVKADTLFDIQQRLQILEQLCTTYSHNPINTSDHENDRKLSNESLPKADAALSIKPSGARYHSQTYKKSLFHHVSLSSIVSR
jgi:hypothetical protein